MTKLEMLPLNQVALYIGNPCFVYSDLTNRWRKDMIDISLLNAADKNSNGAFTQIVPCLRPLTSMTQDEFNGLFNGGYGIGDQEWIDEMASGLYELHKMISKYGDFESIQNLLSMGFDIFFWIGNNKVLDSSFHYDGYLNIKTKP